MYYSVPCKECKVRYGGETGQHFCDRVKQHQNDVRYKKSTNGFYAHLKSHKKHSIDWEKAAFLGKERNWKGRKIKEALFINAQNPRKEISKGNLLNLEKGINLDPILGAFNPELREIATKTILGRT